MKKFEREFIEETNYVSEHKTASILGCSVHKLRKDRSLSRGVPFCVLPPHSIRYNIKQIHAYMDNNTVIFHE